MATFNNSASDHVHLCANRMPGFFFRKRVERIDWKRLGNWIVSNSILFKFSFSGCLPCSQSNGH